MHQPITRTDQEEAIYSLRAAKDALFTVRRETNRARFHFRPVSMAMNKYMIQAEEMQAELDNLIAQIRAWPIKPEPTQLEAAKEA